MKGRSYSNFTDCEWFWNELAQNLQIIKTCENKALVNACIFKDMKSLNEVHLKVFKGELPQATKDGCFGVLSENLKYKARAYVFNLGFSIILYYYYGSRVPIFLLDVNAHRGPNKWGHDIFMFYLNRRLFKDSVFRLEPNKGCFIPEQGGYYTTTFIEYLYGRNVEL